MAASETREGREPEKPVIVLFEPQLGENVGAAARAMLNCGLLDLRLVSPRDGWPNPMATATASGADAVLERVQVFSSVEAAVADLHHVFATTARERDMLKHVVTPEWLASEMRRTGGQGERTGVLFGPERTGLLNDEVALAEAVVRVPLNPAFSSLNLAQSVLLIAYAWYRAGVESPERSFPQERNRAATHGELIALFEHLEGALEVSGFFRVREMKPVTVRQLRNLFQRARPSEHEVRLLHGVVRSLSGLRKGEGVTDG